MSTKGTVKAVTIVAEVGQNHGGNMQLAKTLIRLARENGANLAKFQLYSTDSLERSPRVREILRKGELSFGQAKILFDFGAEIGIEVFFSVFDVERVGWCEKIGVKRYKVAFSQRWDYSIIKAIQKPIILSTGMDDTLLRDTRMKIDYLYCIPDYPARVDFHNVDLAKFSGFSDHTIGLDAAKIALARGAKIIEKHFSIDHQTGADAEYSMTPNELRELRRFAEAYTGTLALCNKE